MAASDSIKSEMALPKYLFSESLGEPLNKRDSNGVASLARDRFEEVEGTELAKEVNFPLSPAANDANLSHAVSTLSRGGCHSL